MAKDKSISTQKLNARQKKAKDWIELGFKNQDSDWAKTARRLVEAYNGKYFKTRSRGDRFSVNTIFSLVNLLLPNLIFNQPHIRVQPQNARYMKPLSDGEFQVVDAVRASMIREASINHLYTKVGGLEEQRKALKDSFFYGFGITKQGYSFDTIVGPDKDYVVKDTPFIKRVDPRDFAWHPLATNLDDSIFLIHRIVTTKDKLKEQGEFKDVDKLVPEIPEHLKKKFGNKDPKQNDFVTVYEVHDLEKDKIYTFAGENKLLISERDNPYDFNGPHFSMIRLADDNDNFEGIPLLAMIEDEAIALNEVMTLIIEHMRKYPSMLFYENGAIDEDDIERIRTGEQGSMHGVNDIEKIKLQNPLPMGAEYFNIVGLLQGLIDRILGVPDFQRGGGSARKSATEATFIQGDASVRREYFLQLVRDFMINGVDKLGKLQAQFQDDIEEIQASGDLRGMTFSYDKSDIQGDFIFTADIEDLRIGRESELNNINNLLQVISSNPVLQPIARSFDPVKLGKRLFNKAGINIESIQTEGIEGAIFVHPEKENAAARKGDPMPQPKKGEDHAWHLETHKKDLLEKGENEPIIRHMAETMIMMQREAGGVVPGAAPGAAQGAGGATPEGPAGPNQGLVEQAISAGRKSLAEGGSTN